MITQEAVTAAMREGYSFPCSMCENLHVAKDRGLDQCMAGILGKECGGPLAGLGFPEYTGVLSRESIAKLCFRCGAPASKIVEGNQGPGLVGVCKRHLPVLSRVMETGDDPWKPITSHQQVQK